MTVLFLPEIIPVINVLAKEYVVCSVADYSCDMARTKTCILHEENKIDKPYFENKTGMFISLSLTKKKICKI
jgi:hypothetical protein